MKENPSSLSTVARSPDELPPCHKIAKMAIFWTVAQPVYLVLLMMIFGNFGLGVFRSGSAETTFMAGIESIGNYLILGWPSILSLLVCMAISRKIGGPSYFRDPSRNGLWSFIRQEIGAVNSPTPNAKVRRRYRVAQLFSTMWLLAFLLVAGLINLFTQPVQPVNPELLKKLIK